MTVHAIPTRKGSTVCTIQLAASIADATKSLARHGIGALVYPVHVITRKSFGLMTRKLSVTESQRSAQFPGTFYAETERRIGELGTSCVALVVSDVSVHEAP